MLGRKAEGDIARKRDKLSGEGVWGAEKESGVPKVQEFGYEEGGKYKKDNIMIVRL